MEYYLAIDLGASSGRHLLGYIDNGNLRIEEIYRFENHLKEKDGHLCWDIDELVNEIINGLKECNKKEKIPTTIGIDTWGVDYVLLDQQDDVIEPVYAYRDQRTFDVIDEVEKIISFAKLYAITGIQKQPFNTIYQLYDDKRKGRLNKAKSMLMIPDYLGYRLTGKKLQEYTNATTTGMVDANKRCWSNEIIEALGFPKSLFSALNEPGTKLGELSKEIQKEVGFISTVILVASHDTASAVASYPTNEEAIYLSSGTWSLIGTENHHPILEKQSLEHNFTNEGGVFHTYRFLKNIMGSWMLQNVRKEYQEEINRNVTFPELIKMARSSSFKELIDVNDNVFLSPISMIKAVKDYLNRPDLKIEDVLSCIYHSLANEYQKAVEEMESDCGKSFDKIYIFGGGCQDQYLNELTKLYTHKRVFAGPIEATAIGNILLQIIYHQKVKDIWEARKLVYKSFDIQEVKGK